MPNWCNNTITISGPKNKITKLYTEAKAGNGLLQAMYPMPKELENTTSPAPKEGEPQPLVDGYDNWYDWRVNNWATKWDVDVENLELSEDGTNISGWFDSAWSPPTGAYEEFLAKNEDCSIKALYYEGGMDFGGEWFDGGDTCLTMSDYSADQMEDPNEGLIYELNEHFNFAESVREYEEEQKNEDAQKVHDFVVNGEAVNGTIKDKETA
jgi:hypothetical protein